MLKNFGYVIRILKNTGQIYINYACHEICLFVSFDDPQGRKVGPSNRPSGGAVRGS